MMSLSKNQKQQSLIWIKLIHTTTQNLSIDNSTISDFCTTELKTINDRVQRDMIRIRSSVKSWNYRVSFWSLMLSCINRMTRGMTQVQSCNEGKFSFQDISITLSDSSVREEVWSKSKRSVWSPQKVDIGYFLIGIWIISWSLSNMESRDGKTNYAGKNGRVQFPIMTSRNTMTHLIS